MVYRQHGPASAMILAAVAAWTVAAWAAGARAQAPGEADRQYQAFKQRYDAAQTAADLRAALPLVQAAFDLAPQTYKYAFGIGATYERLAKFSDCERWFEKAEGLAADDERRGRARNHREYCQNQLDKIAVRSNAPGINISFATKLGFAQREMDAAPLPQVFPHVAESEPDAIVAAVKAKVPKRLSVFARDHLVVAAPGGPAKAAREAERIAEYEAQVRRRFFPGLARKPLILLLGEEPFALRRIAEKLYPGVDIPHAPFFGFYHRRDRLIVATALGGYGTVLHELMHALVEDDFPKAPLWLEEGMATLYERSGWSSERLLPVPNWRMDLIRPEDALAKDAFAGIVARSRVGTEQLAVIRLLFTFLDDHGRLKALYDTVKERGPQTSLVEALDAVGFDRAAWPAFVERSFRLYALEKSTVHGGGLSNPGDIKYVQRALNATIDAGLKPDGLWGSNTENALRTFQRRFGLQVDGMVGSKTMGALRREYGKRSLE